MGTLRNFVESHGSAYKEPDLKFKIRMKDGNSYFKDTTLESVIYQTLSATDSVVNSSFEDLDEATENTGDGLNVVRVNFHKINDNILREVKPAYDQTRKIINKMVDEEGVKYSFAMSIVSRLSYPYELLSLIIIWTFVKRITREEADHVKYFFLVDKESVKN